MKITPLRFLVTLFLCSVLVGFLRLGAAWSCQGQTEVQADAMYRPYSLIEEGLYMGGYVTEPPPGTQAVLNLCQTGDPYKCEIHDWEPIHDSAPAPSIDWLSKRVEFVEAQRRAGHTTYVHCAAGMSRCALVVIAYEMQKNNWTRNEAFQFVRSKRALTSPNPAFMDRLLEWEGVLRMRKAEVEK